jgi:uncharacterized Tic20 family protein
LNNQIPLEFRLLAAGFHVINVIFSTLSTPLVWLLWIFTKQLHPFVDRAGKDAMNCAINTFLGVMVCALFCIFVFSVTCGVGNQDPNPFLWSLIPLAAVYGIYLLNSMIAAIFALQGYGFKSPIIYPFLNSESDL